MRLNNIRTISRKGKINSIKRPFLLVCLNISLDSFPLDRLEVDVNDQWVVNYY